jgi:hypothetical protein
LISWYSLIGSSKRVYPESELNLLLFSQFIHVLNKKLALIINILGWNTNHDLVFNADKAVKSDSRLGGSVLALMEAVNQKQELKLFALKPQIAYRVNWEKRFYEW